MSETTNTAPIKWAQRKDSIYVTISLPDVIDHQIDLTNTKLKFNGSSGGKKYSVDLDFFKEIESEGSIWKVLPSSVQMKLNKKNSEEEFWPRLLIDKALEKTNVSIDWNKYVDEDEADGNDFNVDDLNGGMDFSNLGKAGFGSNTPDDFGEDSDDDMEVPDLEPAISPTS